MKRWSLFFLALGVLAAAPHASKADFVPGIDFTNGDLMTVGFDTAFGYSFKTGSAPLIIDALGLLDGTPPNGQTVRIYKDGTTTNLASVMIPSNAPVSSAMNGHSFAYEPLSTPLNLLPNTTYDIVADLFGLPTGDMFYANTTPVVNVPDITVGAGRQGDPGTFPTSDLGQGHGIAFGPTFEVTPEPASLVLAFAGLPFLGFTWLRRRRKQA